MNMKKIFLKSLSKFSELNILEKIILYTNYIAIFALFISYLAKNIEPEIWILPSLAALFYPVIIFTVCCFTILWAFKLKKPLLYNLIVIALGINTHNDFYKFNKKQNNISENIKMTTFNIRHFNKYNWIDSEDMKYQILKFIEDTESDILCLQEFHDTKNIDSMKFKNKYTNSSFSKTNSGLLIASDFEFLDTKTIIIDTNQNKEIIYVDMYTGKDTLRVYNIHLASLNLNYREIEFIDNPLDSKKNVKKNTIDIYKQIKQSFIKRNKEIKIIANSIKESEKSGFKCIVMGDFNDTPNSYVTSQISKILKDVFIENGSGFGQTYKDINTPIRIDYIFISKGLESNSFKTYNNTKLSDHYPISAEIIY